MANPRNDIETGVETLLAPLETAGLLKTVQSIGGQDYNTVLSAALAKPPFAMIKYVGKSGGLQDGDISHYTAEISILVGAKSYKSLKDQKQSIFDILNAMEDALQGVRISDAYWPLDLQGEQWSQLAGGGTEVWEQRYMIGWDQLPL